MTDHQEIYREQATQYELLVSREDYQGNIHRALNQILPFEGLTVADFGAGTGRLACLVAPVVKRVYAFDRSPHMLSVAKEKLQQSGLKNWQAAVCDHRWMPLETGTVDVAMSGWSVWYVVLENPGSWQAELAKALGEMLRVVRPGGTVVLLESLGTGHEQPGPPAELLPYFAYLEAQGFRKDWIRTDYRFTNRAEAETSARFFFGDEMVAKIMDNEHGVILPECTGIWWKERGRNAKEANNQKTS
jgi:ubiquinone/menaquinone biosynthesis C-methylase UbiE